MFGRKDEGEPLCRYISKPCIGHRCKQYIPVRGVNPQTGEHVDKWDCVDVWIPLLLIENSQQQRQTGAAVESFRNEMTKANEASQQVLLASVVSRLEPKLIGG